MIYWLIYIFCYSPITAMQYDTNVRDKQNDRWMWCKYRNKQLCKFTRVPFYPATTRCK